MATKVIGEAASFIRRKRSYLAAAKARGDEHEAKYIQEYLDEAANAVAWIVGVDFNVLHRVGGCSLRRFSNHICSPVSETQAASYLATGARWCGRCA